MNQKKNTDFEKGEVVLYKNKMEVRLDQDTVWLDAHQMAELFGRDRTVVLKHIHNVFKTKELDKSSTCAKNAQVAADGKIRLMEFYNLDVIISVGYRVNSKRGTQFRIWATNVLKKHLVDGYTLNEKRLKAQGEKIEALQNAVRLLANVKALGGVSDEAKGIIRIVEEYSRALTILDDFDHERLRVPQGSKRLKYQLTYEEARKVIEEMRILFKDSSLVGQEKDQSFKSSLASIYQTFGKKDLYPTAQEKAAHLLYFVTKNHSFIDGNKRIAAALFICFLGKNKMLLHRDGTKTIDENALVALTLMVAASKPSEKDVMIKVILNLLK